MERWLAVVAALSMATSACAGATSSTTIDPPGTSASEVTGEVLVSAAASLTDAFVEVAAEFEAANPGVEVILNLGPSSGLREQILEGAPIDVFASANTENMEMVVEAGEVAGRPHTFARNLLVIAVPSGNPAGISGLADFARDELVIGLCAEAVPCGDFARKALGRAGVTPAIDSNEPDVRALLTKIEADELDAGITYVTDVASGGSGVEGVEIPAEYNVGADYPIAVLAAAPNPGGAVAFVEFVRSEPGVTILAGYGFETP